MHIQGHKKNSCVSFTNEYVQYTVHVAFDHDLNMNSNDILNCLTNIYALR
jgi:hypothetical protein